MKMTGITKKVKDNKYFLGGGWLRKAAVLVFWIALWQAAAMAINKGLLFAGPWDTLKALAALVPQGSFWYTIAFSTLRIGGGFLMAFLASVFLGAAAYRYRWVEELLAPVIMLAKSVPVASFIILALVWIGSKNLSVFVSFVIVLPVLYLQVLQGLGQCSGELLEMARVFGMSTGKKIRYLYLHSLKPFLLAGCQMSLGMCWKAGTAAEVIGATQNSIGGQLYMAKIYLDTTDLFAWTFVIILLSYAFEAVCMRVLRMVFRA